MIESEKEESSALARFRERRPHLYFVGDLLLNIVIIVILVGVIRTFLLSPFQVFGPSMCDTLNTIDGECKSGFGEYLIVNKALYREVGEWRIGDPERGDIVVFRPPHNTKDFYIKRVIGLPGEKIKIQNGKVFIFNEEHQSGWQIPEPYLNEHNKDKTYLIPAQRSETFEVPAGEYFVMGDNRDKSTDSRSCFHGSSADACEDRSDHFLERSSIEGKASIVLWPFRTIRILRDPSYETETASTDNS
ncbi:signal peptidase I [Candidatus Peregrinibacteria bacterium CG_4_9_14_0_2_um_filter_53_11]|nr:MAG: signal peptidase I [Candidatus Peregrinibacteria bacterium CG_4_9_14_0_2_um_filter_53_11]